VQPGTRNALVTRNLAGRIAVSDDGNVLVFVSGQPGLVPTLATGYGVFRLDRARAELRHLSARSSGNHDASKSISMTADARLVAFTQHSIRSAVYADVYVYDAVANTLSLASTDETGTLGNGSSTAPYLTPNGETLVFTSTSTNWNSTPRIAGDLDVFVKRLGEQPLLRDRFE